ncbi:DNA/RNA non-specific endonuclease [Streptomyces sp. YIM 98790]|uniref:DNA/RNA non-specific endonuclease n=1 Tax=Streptomyces sp. YIM 98790 TaxID=2689077 RepID=UPI001409E053|nr:DNA/RNA non-specific endonuclease [Streptomyces sp. YIM 98790]
MGTEQPAPAPGPPADEAGTGTGPGGTGPGGPAAAGAAASRLDGRTGYDPWFLGVEVPLPRPVDPLLETVLLPYTHFSVLLRPDRRLAAATAVAIDGARLRRSGRDSRWRLDPRAPAAHQAGGELYEDNPLDRGHLVRRLDPVWGDRDEAERADDDTFHFTNAAPQAEEFNQGRKLWLGLEDFLLQHAAAHERRLAVSTGPVLRESDPLYRGVRIPLSFWKVAAFLDRGELGATGYLLDQTPDLRRAAPAPGEPPPLGPFRTFQVPVRDVAALTGLDFGPLPVADRLPVAPGVAPGPARWRELTSHHDITWRAGDVAAEGPPAPPV